MKVIVFGGTGSIGSLVVEQALEQGHDITLLTRSRSSVHAQHPRLRIVEADVFDSVAMTPYIAGHDAVVVTLGAGAKGGVRGPGTASVIDAMHAGGVRRLIVQSTLGIGDSRANLDFYWKHLMFGVLLRRAYADHEEQERVTKASGLDWTIVRPAAFTDGPRTRRYEVGFGPHETPGMKIARADVADFIVGQLSDDSWMLRTPALASA